MIVARIRGIVMAMDIVTVEVLTGVVIVMAAAIVVVDLMEAGLVVVEEAGMGGIREFTICDIRFTRLTAEGEILNYR